MRTIVALAVMAASMTLGGCFYHHYQQASITELPSPPVSTPIK
jgi:hypothetical protein